MLNQPIEQPVLVVDLDGTLLRSDMLFESFWSALGSDWRSPVRAVGALTKGKAVLKRYLAENSRVDVATLPYDEEVLAYVRDWREKGGRTALVTATDEAVAAEISEHLGIFDEVHGSDGETNLKGEAKARFLAERFPDTGPATDGEADAGTAAPGFVYMGDSTADVAVWQGARKAVTVNAPAALRSRVEALDTETEHLGQAGRNTRPYIKALRPHQWLKNILVFLPMLTAHQLDGATFLKSLLAFIAFSLVASSVYVINDLLDLAADRAHPRKRARPFASGAIPIAHGTWMAGGLLGGGALISLLLGGQFFLVMLIYYAITSAYSLTLKRRAVIDICTLASLYTLRIVAGAAATTIPLSVWLLAFSIFVFFALAAVKRQAELVDNIERGKLDISGRGYHVDDLPVISMMAISSGYVAILIMALYLNSPAVVELYSAPEVLWGICFVLLYWISRIVMVTHRGHMHDDPVVFAARDRNSQICFVLILAMALGGALL